MRPPRANIAAPPFPPGLGWPRPARSDRMEVLASKGPVLVHFFCAAQLNGVRTLPYLRHWHERYAGHGLTTVGIVAPRYPFAGEPVWLDEALDELDVPYPVALDSEYLLWSDYGCRGWPSLFLWSRGGALRWAHFGEGAYEDTERAIQDELRAAGTKDELPDPLGPLRPGDDPQARIARQSDEVFPGGDVSEPHTATPDADRITLGYEAGEAWATIEGPGNAAVGVDDEERRPLEVRRSGLVALALHPRHERHTLELTLEPGQRLWSISFAPGLA